MKTLIAIFLLAMVVCTMAQYYGGYLGNYGYGYNTYTPGARVSHYASGYGPGYYGYGYPYVFK